MSSSLASEVARWAREWRITKVEEGHEEGEGGDAHSMIAARLALTGQRSRGREDFAATKS